ncbi:hypothetical protein N658DRAFT_73690 [Parathielavia hyrcaniae]|uniref:Uncharacterized protein n=1 Tax=Parathielavia hyrcaniae TaxID=113614 RepID=A0AAN6SX06_9PEZI|nr:hypothetical protein N658DRAFT_73690 [Parathielavia hyrcaniae]
MLLGSSAAYRLPISMRNASDSLTKASSTAMRRLSSDLSAHVCPGSAVGDARRWFWGNHLGKVECSCGPARPPIRAIHRGGASITTTTPDGAGLRRANHTMLIGFSLLHIVWLVGMEELQTISKDLNNRARPVRCPSQSQSSCRTWGTGRDPRLLSLASSSIRRAV